MLPQQHFNRLHVGEAVGPKVLTRALDLLYAGAEGAEPVGGWVEVGGCIPNGTGALLLKGLRERWTAKT